LFDKLIQIFFIFIIIIRLIYCDELIKEANELYQTFMKSDNKNKLFKEDLNYIETMNKYINSFQYYKERQIKQYIIDLHEYISIMI
jgi:hypothetical protein